MSRQHACQRRWCLQQQLLRFWWPAFPQHACQMRTWCLHQQLLLLLLLLMRQGHAQHACRRRTLLPLLLVTARSLVFVGGVALFAGGSGGCFSAPGSVFCFADVRIHPGHVVLTGPVLIQTAVVNGRASSNASSSTALPPSLVVYHGRFTFVLVLNARRCPRSHHQSIDGRLLPMVVVVSVGG